MFLYHRKGQYAIDKYATGCMSMLRLFLYYWHFKIAKSQPCSKSACHVLVLIERATISWTHRKFGMGFKCWAFEVGC